MGLQQRILRAAAVAAASATLALAGAGVAAAQAVPATWLDRPLVAWNTPGEAVPRAAIIEAPGGMCMAQERGPSSPEDLQVYTGTLGWRLEQYWPNVRRGADAIVLATSRYDGMCRPIGYQAFAFRGGRYAGTLSPVEMDSRTDGSLTDPPVFSGDGTIVATFTRYAPTDPLCCPSRPATRVTYRIENAAGGPVVVPAGTGAGAGLPRTGSGAGAAVPTAGIAAALALGAVASGLAAARRRRSRPA
jgi:hypothetical protein